MSCNPFSTHWQEAVEHKSKEDAMSSDYRETRIEEVPIKRARPVVESRRDSVVHETRGMSGGAIAALVLASIAVGVLIAMLIVNTQQRNRDEELAQERDRMAAAQQAQPQQQPLQQPAQQPPIIVTPQPQPGTTPVPVPAPSAPAPSAAAQPSSAQLEADATAKFLDDQDLRAHPIDVKVTGGTAMLSGEVPTEGLKDRAEKIARSVKGIRSVINNLVVKPE
jgi:BON domain-containing protein